MIEIQPFLMTVAEMAICRAQNAKTDEGIGCGRKMTRLIQLNDVRNQQNFLITMEEPLFNSGELARVLLQFRSTTTLFHLQIEDQQKNSTKT